MVLNCLVCLIIGQTPPNHFRVNCNITFGQKFEMALHVDWSSLNLVYGSTFLITIYLTDNIYCTRNLCHGKRKENYLCMYETFNPSTPPLSYNNFCKASNWQYIHSVWIYERVDHAWPSFLAYFKRLLL